MQRAAPLVALVLLSGCATLVGLDRSYADADAGGGAGACDPGNVCAPPAPDGWQLEAYHPSARPGCAPGYTAPSDVEEGIVAPDATCDCSCTLTPPSCDVGSMSFTAGTDTACTNRATLALSAAASSCTLVSSSFNVKNSESFSVSGPAPAGGSCAPSVAKSVAPPSPSSLGQLCMPAQPPSGACSGGACLPDPSPFRLCVSQVGRAACPSGYPIEHEVGAHVADTRDCACGCSFDAGKCEGTATFFYDTACTKNPTAIPVDGDCHDASATNKVSAYTYAPMSTAACTPTGGPTGAATFADARTVCCVD